MELDIHVTIPFVGSSYQLKTRKADVQRTINLMPTRAESGKVVQRQYLNGAKAQMFLQAVPGLGTGGTLADGRANPDAWSPASPAPHICVDGPSWTATSIAAANWHYSAFGLVAGLPRYVAIGQNPITGDAVSSVSTDLGATWGGLSILGSFGGNAGQVVHGAGLFLAAMNAIQYVTSSDGVTWSTHSWPSTFPSGLVYGGGQFVVFGNTTTLIRISADGLTWGSATAPFFADFTCAAYGGGIWVGISESRAIFSLNATSWTASTTTWPASSWQSIAYGAGVFVIIDKSQAFAPVAKWSSDGDVWNAVNLPFDGTSTYDGLIYAQGRFFATKNNSTAFAISTDGKVWTLAAHTTPSGTARWGALNTDGNTSYIGLNTFSNGVTNAMKGTC